MAGWDVGLLPLTGPALGDEAEAAALQMLAAGLPVIVCGGSNIAADCAALGADATVVSAGVAELLAALDNSWPESPLSRDARRARARQRYRDRTWDRLADRAHRQLLALRDDVAPARTDPISAVSQR